MCSVCILRLESWDFEMICTLGLGLTWNELHQGLYLHRGLLFTYCLHLGLVFTRNTCPGLVFT